MIVYFFFNNIRTYELGGKHYSFKTIGFYLKFSIFQDEESNVHIRCMILDISWRHFIPGEELHLP